MAKCKSCSAPLSSSSNICEYCGVRNEVDLRGIHNYTVSKPKSDRICPNCKKPMSTIDLGIDGNFFIEQCQICMGLFFDPGELEILLDKSVKNVFNIQYKKIRTINKELHTIHKRPMYIKCPVCQDMMHRINFGTRSGVIIDRCKQDGIWLEAGELKHLFEWSKAGGQILDKNRKEDEERRKEHKKISKAIDQQHMKHTHSSSYENSDLHSHDNELDLLNLVSKLAVRFFR